MCTLASILESGCDNSGIDEVYINSTDNLTLTALGTPFTDRTITAWTVTSPFVKIEFDGTLGNYTSTKAPDSKENVQAVTLSLRGKDPDAINNLNELVNCCEKLVVVCRHAGEDTFRVFGLDIKKGATVVTDNILKPVKIGYSDGSGVVTDANAVTEITFASSLYKQTALFASVTPPIV